MPWKYPNIMADPENCFGWGTTHGERVEREPTTGFWGQSPQRSPGAEPLVGVRGRSPIEAESFFGS